jgi:hypothetical protein
MLDTIPLAAAPPPALLLTPGLPCLPRFLWQVEEGGSSASAVDPPSSKPRREAKSRPEAGRRPVGLLGPTRRHRRQETDARKPIGTRDGGSGRAPREFVAVDGWSSTWVADLEQRLRGRRRRRASSQGPVGHFSGLLEPRQYSTRAAARAWPTSSTTSRSSTAPSPAAASPPSRRDTPDGAADADGIPFYSIQARPSARPAAPAEPMVTLATAPGCRGADDDQARTASGAGGRRGGAGASHLDGAGADRGARRRAPTIPTRRPRTRPPTRAMPMATASTARTCRARARLKSAAAMATRATVGARRQRELRKPDGVQGLVFSPSEYPNIRRQFGVRSGGAGHDGWC